MGYRSLLVLKHLTSFLFVLQIVIANRDIDRLSSNQVAVKYVSEPLILLKYISILFIEVLSTNQSHDLKELL